MSSSKTITNQPRCRFQERSRFFTVVRVFVAITFVGHLLFAHGCHGDEDHELFAQVLLGWKSASRLVGANFE